VAVLKAPSRRHDPGKGALCVGAAMLLETARDARALWS
jgi:hypothetical protein